MTKKDIHVVPHKGGWATKKEGAGRVGVVTDTQKQAINRAKEQAVREKVEYAKAWCDEGGGSEIATARLKDRAEAMLLREKSVRAELRSIADRIRTGFAGGEHAAADAIERALADLP
jgi:lysyl-tRNA synthetase class I